MSCSHREKSKSSNSCRCKQIAPKYPSETSLGFGEPRETSSTSRKPMSTHGSCISPVAALGFCPCIRCGTRSGASSTGKARKRCKLRVGPLQCWIIFLVLAGVYSRTLDRWPVAYQLKEVSHPGWIWSCRTSTTNLTLRSRGEKCC